jgi:hypothetical protein
MTDKSCENCKKILPIESFHSKTLQAESNRCNKCRAQEYMKKSRPKNNSTKAKHDKYQHFLKCRQEPCKFIPDLFGIILEFLDNYTKFKCYATYGNILETTCGSWGCSAKAVLCSLSISPNIKCGYCRRLLYTKYELLMFRCYQHISFDTEMGEFLEDKAECICNGRRQMYSLELKSVIMKFPR